jgi:hypothetical protein
MHLIMVPYKHYECPHLNPCSTDEHELLMYYQGGCREAHTVYGSTRLTACLLEKQLFEQNAATVG